MSETMYEVDLELVTKQIKTVSVFASSKQEAISKAIANGKTLKWNKNIAGSITSLNCEAVQQPITNNQRRSR